MMVPSATDIQWLLTCLKQPIEKHHKVLLSLCKDVDWEKLIPYVARHGLLPVLFWQIRSNAELWSAIPSFARDKLLRSYESNGFRNLMIYHSFRKLIKVLKEINIPIIVLKGVYLAQIVYGDRALREMGDVDLLVRYSDLERVESSLQASGFQFSGKHHRDWYLANHYHLAYVDPKTLVNVEIHWDIQRPTAPFPVDVDELWRDARPVSIAEVEVLALSTEHLLLHHCLHIAKHGFNVGLRHFYDLVAILKYDAAQINWQQLWIGAERWQITKAVYLSLYFTQELFDGVPDFVMPPLAPAMGETSIADTAREQIFAVGNDVQISSEFLKVLSTNQGQMRVSRLMRRIFLPIDSMATIYRLSPKSWRLYLYYPVRIFDLLIRYPHVIRKLAERDETVLTMAEKSNKVEALRQWLAT